MKNWNNITKKLPKINRHIFIMDKDKKEIMIAKLVVFNKSHKLNDVEDLRFGDVFWRVLNDINDIEEESKARYTWTTTDLYPYWMLSSDLTKLSLINEEDDNEEDDGSNSNRFELMDI